MKRQRRLLVGLLVLLMGADIPCAQEKAATPNRLQLAARFMESGKSEKALALYEELYKEDPQIFVYKEYLKCLQKLGHYEKAEKVIRKQMRASRTAVLVKVDLAANFIRMGQNKKAEAVFAEIKKSDLFSGGVSVQELAQAVVNETGRYDVAADLYQTLRQMECGTPENSDCYALYAEALADYYRMDGKMEPMLDEYLLLMSHDEEQSDKVFSRLQGLLAGGEKNASKKNLETLKRLLYRKIQQQPETASVQDVLIWVLLQEKDFETALVQARSYSRRFNDGGIKWLESIRTVAQNEKFDLAVTQYELLLNTAADKSLHIAPQNARRARIELLNLYFAQLERQSRKDLDKAHRLTQSYKNLMREAGREPEAFEMNRNLAKIYAYYLQEKDSAVFYIEKALQEGRFSGVQRAQLKIDLADILLYYDKVWDAMLLYGQVEKDFKQDPVGFYAKLQNARLSYYIGEFEWAKSQLDVLRAATAKLIANDAMELSLMIRENMNPDSAYDGLAVVARADFLVYRHLYAPALRLLDSVLRMPLEGALFDEVYYRKAHVYLAMDSVQEALTWLKAVYDYPEDDLLADDALFEAAEILQNQNKTQEAMELYQRLFLDFKSSSLAPLARQRYRLLRGDGKMQESL